MATPTQNNYLSKHANYPNLIERKAKPDLSIVVVIPCYNEPNITRTLDSLAQCETENFSTEVIVVINQSEEEAELIINQNLLSYQDAQKWKNKLAPFDLHTLNIKGIPHKKAGVGYARKTGMDEAVRRLDSSTASQHIIVCLDADTTVEPNYLQAIYNYFQANPKCPAASIHYVHPFDNPDAKVNQAIMEYELHLRYYVLAQRWAGLDYAYQTVGSAMAVRSGDYQKQGGMNTRKAGEDFYFIHKFTHFNDFGNINETVVTPSARVSDRVPFGTGRAMQSLLAEDKALTSYAPQSFAAIKKLVDQLPNLHAGDHTLKSAEAMSFFLGNYQFTKKLEEIRSNTSDYASFKKRFFRWFDAFLCMKFLHFARDHHYPNIPILEASNWLNKTSFGSTESLVESELLTIFRAQTKAYL